MGPPGWLLSLTPKARKSRKKERELERIKIALLIAVDNHEMGAGTVQTICFKVNAWFADMHYPGRMCVDQEMVKRCMRECAGLDLVDLQAESDFQLKLSMKGKKELSKYENYSMALESYDTFLKGGRGYLQQFEIVGRFSVLSCRVTNYCDW